MAEKEQELPLHRRFGLRFLQFLIIVVAFVLIRNCIIISINGSSTDLEIQQQYYERGFEAGKQKALYGTKDMDEKYPDLLLERKYREGYRDGWDRTKKQK